MGHMDGWTTSGPFLPYPLTVECPGTGLRLLASWMWIQVI